MDSSPTAGDVNSNVQAEEAAPKALCKRCSLPLGEEVTYQDAYDPEGRLHGECMAQLLLGDLKYNREEEERKHAEEKQRLRRELDIGWQADRIPRSKDLALRFGASAVPGGMCCLVLEDEGRSVRIAATTESAAAVNLEYLSLALRVRTLEGREPLFSLDPVGRQKESMQEKRFEPAWLVGTSTGEVLFQADYHLKELSMGEYAQPVVGMKSCFDLTEEADSEAEQWFAREWFVLRHAAVQISRDGALVPSLQVAVEAREQEYGDYGFEDRKVTTPDHPLVKYAEAFTHNFELIAERKSVVHQLCEVAKATILAKFLVEGEVTLDATWLELPSEPAELCVLEVPQLWNSLYRTQVRVENRCIHGMAPSVGYTLYGGVQFGLDRFHLAGGRSGLTARLSARQLVQPERQLAAGLSARQFQRFGATLGSTRGVDLNLDNFSLDELGEWEGEVLGTCEHAGCAFWSSPIAGEELMQRVYDPRLCDRREDGEAFTPLDMSVRHLARLQRLVGEEDAARDARKAHFSSEAFEVGRPGPLFPCSWRPADEISYVGVQRRALRHRDACDAGDVEAVLATTPVFEKRSEEGLCFRVYRAADLEVRTLQEPDGRESVVATLSPEVARAAEGTQCDGRG